MSLGREILFARLKKRILRKNEKHFLFFLKNAYFSSKSWQNSSKIWIKKVLGKKSYHFWKNWRRAIYPCNYLNFDFFDENRLFLSGGGGA